VVKLENKMHTRGIAACDDEWSFNTQCSSQWDGCRHYAYQPDNGEGGGQYYMGRTAEEFESGTTANGIQHMAKQGVAGKGLLVDWWAWKLARGEAEDVDAFSAYAIPWEELIAAAEAQGTPLAQMEAGDVLVVRSGMLKQYEEMEDAKRAELEALYQHTKPSNIGVRACPELLEFLWEKQIAAVASDSRSFERWPCPEEEKHWHLHQWLLAGWGMPIGELWDLEALSEMCAKQKRWTFFLSSAPMNVPGGVASPPNALAFF
jgi:kynurenine formamidase